MSIAWGTPIEGTDHRAIRFSVVRSDARTWIARLEGERELAVLAVLAVGGRCAWTKLARPLAHQELQLRFGPQGPLSDSRVNFSFGNASDLLSAQASLASVESAVQWRGDEQIETGRLLHLVTVAGELEIQGGALVLDRADVRFGRNHLWRPSPRLLSDGFGAMLARGRSGLFHPWSS